MTGAQQLANDIWNAIKRHRMESILTYYEVIGILEFIKYQLSVEALDDEEDEDDDEIDEEDEEGEEWKN